MQFYYENVKGLGSVVVSHHALKRIEEEGISEELFKKVLLTPIGSDTPDSLDIVWRERNGIRLVINIDPDVNSGAKVVKTVYRIQAQAKARR